MPAVKKKLYGDMGYELWVTEFTPWVCAVSPTVFRMIGFPYYFFVRSGSRGTGIKAYEPATDRVCYFMRATELESFRALESRPEWKRGQRDG